MSGIMKGNSKQIMDLIRQGIEEGFKRDMQIELNRVALEIAEKTAQDVAQRVSALVARYDNVAEDRIEIQVRFNMAAGTTNE